MPGGGGGGGGGGTAGRGAAGRGVAGAGLWRRRGGGGSAAPARPAPRPAPRAPRPAAPHPAQRCRRWRGAFARTPPPPPPTWCPLTHRAPTARTARCCGGRPRPAAGARAHGARRRRGAAARPAARGKQRPHLPAAARATPPPPPPARLDAGVDRGVEVPLDWGEGGGYPPVGSGALAGRAGLRWRRPRPPAPPRAGGGARAAARALVGNSGSRPACTSANPRVMVSTTHDSSGSRCAVVLCWPTRAGRHLKVGRSLRARFTCAQAADF